MQEILKKFHPEILPTDYIVEILTHRGVREITINLKKMFIVCDEEGEEEILRSYREASIEAARLDIPKEYHDFFEFNEFADYTWQTLYDIYDVVEEVVYNNKKYFICSV